MKKIILAAFTVAMLAGCANNKGNDNGSTADSTEKKMKVEEAAGTRAPDGSTMDTSRSNMLNDTNLIKRDSIRGLPHGGK